MTLPPYRMGTRLVTPRDPSSNRISSCTWAASSGEAFRPVPMAQTGSYASRIAVPVRQGDPLQDRVHLPLDHLLGAAALALGQRLAHADQRSGPALEGGRHLAADLLVGLAEEMAPLRVADEHRPRARLLHQRHRELAGEGALGLPVHVLRADDDVTPAGGGFGDRGDGYRGRKEPETPFRRPGR